jgi:hypothetical protein
MDNIWKNAARKQRARDLRDTTVTSTLTTPVRTTLPVITTTTPKWCDPETATLEQIDENTWRLLREWPKDNGTPFPMEILEVLRDLKLRVRARDAEKTRSTTVSVTTNTDTAVVKSTTVEPRDTKQSENRENKERMEGEEERQWRRGENEEEHKDEEKAKQEAMKEACPQTGRDDATHHQPTLFNWATNTDSSIGPVPNVSDFRPATPSQPTRTPSDRIPTSPAPTDCTPTAYTPAAPALIDPDPGDVAPRAHTLATRLPTDNLVPVDPNPATPTPATCVPTEPQVRTPLIAHGLRDLSALRSGTSNPWGSIKRRRHCLHPLRDLSSLRSGTSNPWSSLRYRNRRSYPLHRHNTHSQPDPIQYSHLYPHHPEKSQPLRNSSSYLHPLPPQLNSRS